MPKMDFTRVADHYRSGKLVQHLHRAAANMGKAATDFSVDELSKLDEFHIGGREASHALFDPLNFDRKTRVADFGCGLGGPARFVAQNYGAYVDGIDLTEEFVDAGREMNTWTGLDDLVTLYHGNALDTGFASNAYDAACMLHVGMNISDKDALFTEVARVLRPRGVFALYDVMKTGDAPLDYPVPWAATPDTSAIAPLATYRDALAKAGLVIESEQDLSRFGLDFFNRVLKDATSGTIHQLGVHLILGKDTPAMFENMLKNLNSKRMAPMVVIARKP